MTQRTSHIPRRSPQILHGCLWSQIIVKTIRNSLVILFSSTVDLETTLNPGLSSPQISSRHPADRHKPLQRVVQWGSESEAAGQPGFKHPLLLEPHTWAQQAWVQLSQIRPNEVASNKGFPICGPFIPSLFPVELTQASGDGHLSRKSHLGTIQRKKPIQQALTTTSD